MTDLHTVGGFIEPDDDVRENLEGRWHVELIREREVSILRWMTRA